VDVYVARAQGFALLFNDCQYTAMKTWAKEFSWDMNLQSTISFVVNRDLRSMTIRVPDRHPNIVTSLKKGSRHANFMKIHATGIFPLFHSEASIAN